MKISYKIEGLDCANCAVKLEKSIEKIEGVKQVNVNFMMQRIELEYDENEKDEVIKNVKKVIRREEPDVEIEEI